ncbi:MAG TPA: aminotransferase class I/II-fold pyridoxal phosphate-dependent enzyme [Clostridiales bacterium]|nr:aminotransferase class I/II-fold pyridoxal phosphate-dependent enzyme [Clostridiales bacterium]
MEEKIYSPLYEAIKAHNAKQAVPFHMPGHKGHAEVLDALSCVLPYDLTELPDTGSLFDGEGPTLEAEKLAAELFQTAGSFFSAGGCSLCIQTMLRLAMPQGGKMVCGRLIHRSVINAMALLGIEPVWVLHDNSGGENFAGRLKAEDVERTLKENPDAKAVFVTSPDYFGLISDTGSIGKVCDRHNIPLLVDNAHGAHLYFLEENLAPVRLGAAMSADSAHKTLPVLTGGAWLNIGDEKYLTGVREAMALFGSTSPSYPIMLSLDLCRAWLSGEGKDRIRKTAAFIAEFKEKVEYLGYDLPKGPTDPMRLAFRADSLGYEPGEVGEFLRGKGIEPEYAGEEGLILIPTPFNPEGDFESLYEALKDLAAHPKTKNKREQKSIYANGLPQAKMTPRAALLAQSEIVATKDAKGRVAARVICPCPPAIPLVIPGELISSREVENLLRASYFEVCVVK